MKEWEAILAASGLADAGRFKEATSLSNLFSGGGFDDVVHFRANKKSALAEPALLGWESYYRGQYRDALQNFLSQKGGGWLQAWAELGIAKVASDCGYWMIAMNWCDSAWNTATAGEHLDLLAEICGAKGEIYLRSGKHLRAAEAFCHDLGLLAPGSRFVGRVRCYQAHAWGRLGPQGRKAARLSYRLAMHSPGEATTAQYATAGLALLAVEENDPKLLGATLGGDKDRTGLAGFWCTIALARATEEASEFAKLVDQARAMLPEIYYAEHVWLTCWSECAVSWPSIPELTPPGEIPLPEKAPVGLPGTSSIDLLNATAPWHSQARSADLSHRTPIDWWRERQVFMP